MTSYGYQITSTTVKLTTLNDCFYDLSENAYMSMDTLLSEKVYCMKVFTRQPFSVKINNGMAPSIHNSQALKGLILSTQVSIILCLM